MKDICPNKKLEAKIWSKIITAIEEFDLIKDGDRVIIGVSGGKDSLTLLRMLSRMRKFKKLNFELIVGHMAADVSSGNIDRPETIEEICKKFDVPFYCEKVSLKNPEFNKRGKVDCYWCSYQRRRVIFKLAEEHKCTKIIFAHHQDDFVITSFMNLFYISSVLPMRVKHSFFDGKYDIIRPMCLVREKEVIEYAKIMEFPSSPCNCPIGKDGRREEVAGILKNLEKNNKGIVDSVFWAYVKNSRSVEGWEV